MRKKGSWRNCNVNISRDDLAHADRLLSFMRDDPMWKDCPQLTRSYVLRLAIPKGLAIVEAEIKGGKNE